MTAHHPDDRVVLRRVADVPTAPIDWLWQGYVARGKVSMIAGNPGLGKSQVTAFMAAVVTTGGNWPANGGSCRPGNVVILSAEDDPADTIKPRLLAAGADTAKCHVLDAVEVGGGADGAETRSFNLQQDIDRLARSLEVIGGADLIVIDPITAYMGGVDSHKNAEVRTVLASLTDLAERVGAAVVGVSHFNKASGVEALHRVIGSLGFVAAARAVFGVFRDQDDPDRRLFLPLKNNIAVDQSGLAFRVEPHELGDGISTSSVIWEATKVSVTADEAMQVKPKEDSGQTAEISGWLHDLLAPGRMKAHEVRAKATQSGFAWRTVQRVARAIDLFIKRDGFGKDAAYYWSLTPCAPRDSMCASTDGVARMVDGGAHDEGGDWEERF